MKCPKCGKEMVRNTNPFIAQLNVYAFLYRMTGFPVTSLKVHAILRDWVKGRSLREEDYPPIPFVTVNIPVWSDEEVQAYIGDRMVRHFDLPAERCTDEERWYKGTTFAVKKKGQKRARRVLNTMQEAEAWIGEEKGLIIEERKGADVRCENYCLVRNVCPYMEGE